MVYKRVGDGAVLLSSVDEVYYGLNLVGAQIWEHLPPQLNTSTQLFHAIQRLYPDVDPSMIQTDVAELLGDLLAKGLVLARDAAQPAPSSA